MRFRCTFVAAVVASVSAIVLTSIVGVIHAAPPSLPVHQPTFAQLPVASSSELPFSVSGFEKALITAQSYTASGPIFINQSSDVSKLTNVHYFLVRGQVQKGRYVFPLTLNAAAGTHGKMEGQIIAYSNSDHTEFVAIGEVQSGLGMIPQYICHGSVSTQLHVRFTDRVNIPLADIYQPLAWNYNCSTVTWFNASGAYETWAVDGWSETSASRVSGYTNSSDQTVQSWTDADFENTLFCGYDVLIWDDSIAYGTFTGSKSAKINPYISKTCQPLYYSWWWDY